jgi:hypothetical protein
MYSSRRFEGEFSFFLPLTFDPDSYLSRLDVLTNLDMTAEVLWELAPWSWLVDWFLHLQDSIASNLLAANDRLIMHYGYAFEKTVYETELNWRRTGSTASSIWFGIPSSGRYTATTTYKRRLRANPFGFQVGPDGSLSGNQMSILGALALTKGYR